MGMLNSRIQLIAGDPIEIGGRRFLPSVLVESTEIPGNAAFTAKWVQIRPSSVVEEGPDGARWLAIRDVTTEALSVMGAVAVGVAVVGSLILLLNRWVRK